MVQKRGGIAVLSLVAVVVVAVISSAAGAAPGDLDPSFGSGGKVVNGDFGWGEAVLVQPNGKIVVGGASDGGDFALARYTPDGALDPVFDGDGTVTTDFGLGDSVSAIAFRPGYLVAAGISSQLPPSGHFAVARYRLDGSLDPMFDGDGKVAVNFGARSAYCRDLAVQPDGKIVVVGAIEPDSSSGFSFALARFNQDGSLDPSFGTGGLVITDLGGPNDGAQAVALQSDGRIVVAGRTGNIGPSDFAVVRYETNGALDPSFDEDGKATIDFGGDEEASEVVLQTDGKILVVGATGSLATGQDFALARLNTDGSLDTQGLDPFIDAPFGTAGKVVTDFDGEEDQATSVILEPNGNILVAGPVSRPVSGVDSDFGLARYRIDGSLDPSFGVGGKVTTAVTASEDRPHDLTLQRDGRIVVAGPVIELIDGELESDLALVRYLVRGCCFGDGKPPGPPPLP